MASTPCGSCGQLIFPGVSSCPHCGAVNRFNWKALAPRFPVVLLGVAVLAGLTVLFAPTTKHLVCEFGSSNSDRSGAPAAQRDDDPAASTTERFSLDLASHQVVFPGGKEFKPESVTYSVRGKTLAFIDGVGAKHVLNTSTGQLRVYAKVGPNASWRLQAIASCSGL